MLFKKEDGREKERNINVRQKHWLAAPVCAPTGDWTCKLCMCPDQESNLKSLGAWDNTSTNWATLARVFSFYKFYTIFFICLVTFYQMPAIIYEKFIEILDKLLASGRQLKNRQSNFVYHVWAIASLSFSINKILFILSLPLILGTVIQGPQLEIWGVLMGLELQFLFSRDCQKLCLAF